MKEKTKNNPVRILIEANPKFDREFPKHDNFIEISEFFGPTLQGEGVNIGVPSVFLRVKNCVQQCVFCDTLSVWKHGNSYTFEEVFELMESTKTIELLKNGVHLILTGGSPLKQQDKFIEFFKLFEEKYGFLPYIEVENESVLMPKPEFVKLIKCWNNSPKLENSGNPKGLRYQPEVLKFLSSLENSWFKFVIGNHSDWYEIQSDFLDKGLIKKNQIIFMPLGESQEELNQSREIAAQLSIRENIRFTDRLHITLWDKKVSV